MLAALLERAERHFSDRVAILEGERRMTYAAVVGRARRLAAGLRALGAEPGERIAVLDHNGTRYLETYFACALAGITIVPLNFRLAARELDAILAEADIRVLVAGEAFAEIVETFATTAVRLDPDGYERLVAVSRPLATLPQVPLGVSAIYYTSGTTGEPKGVCLSERGIAAGIADALYGLALQPADVWLHAAPLFHLADACAIWAVTATGAGHAMLHFAPDAFLRAVASMRVTTTSIPPTLINMIASSDEGRRSDLSSLRRISFGGSPMPPDVFRRGIEVFRCEMFQAYGITETAGFVACGLPGDEAPAYATIGRPTPAIELRVMRDDGTEADPGEVGELAVRSAKVMSGYWKKPEATAAVLRDGWYFTGDLGARDARGLHFIRGRKKDMIITGGENVYAVEVENALAAHPAVFEVAVIGVPDARWGEAVHAVVVPRPGSSPTAAELIDWCRARIGGYKVPKSIDFSSEPLPKSGPGKIAKHLIRRRAA